MLRWPLIIGSLIVASTILTVIVLVGEVKKKKEERKWSKPLTNFGCLLLVISTANSSSWSFLLSLASVIVFIMASVIIRREIKKKE